MTGKQNLKSRKKAPDILNDFLGSGGTIFFHSGEYERKFIRSNEILETGFWDAKDGAGKPCRIPYKFTAVLGKPVRHTGGQ